MHTGDRHLRCRKQFEEGAHDFVHSLRPPARGARLFQQVPVKAEERTKELRSRIGESVSLCGQFLHCLLEIRAAAQSIAGPWFPGSLFVTREDDSFVLLIVVEGWLEI